jgi:LEA14-like dessication related protein
MKIKLLTLLIGIILLSSCKFYKDVNVYEVQDVRVKEFSHEMVRAEVDVKVDNPNWYKIKVKESQIKLSINGDYIGIMELDSSLVVPKKSTSVQTIAISTDYADAQTNFLQNTLMLLFAKSVLISAEGHVVGKALIVRKKMPVKLEKQVDLDQIKFGK